MTSATDRITSNTVNFTTEVGENTLPKNSNWNSRSVASVGEEFDTSTASISSLLSSQNKPSNYEEEVALFRTSLPTALHNVVCTFLDPTSEIIDLVKKDVEIPDYLKKLAKNVVHLDLNDHALDYFQVRTLLDCFRNIKSLKLSRNHTDDPQSPDYQTCRPYQLLTDSNPDAINAVVESILSISTLENLEELDISSWLFSETEARFPNMYALITAKGNLKSISISNSCINDEQLSSIISSCRGLEVLRLNDCVSLSESVLLKLKNLTKLKSIELESCRGVTDEVVLNLSEISTLEQLSICRLTSITSYGIEGLTQCCNLKRLNVSHCNINEESFRLISSFKNLTHLNMHGCRFDSVAIRHIEDCSKLKYLDISDCEIYDDGLFYVGKLSELEHLDISETLVGRDSLKHLYPLKKLKTLNAYFIGITQEDLDNFKREIPDLEVNFSKDHTESQFRLAPFNDSFLSNPVFNAFRFILGL